VRIGWQDLPAPVQARAEQIIGGRVVEARSQAGGFSPGTADRVRTDRGLRAFVKAVAPAINEISARMARDEMRITSAMPPGVPVPRMLGGFDDGEWVVLILEDVEGTHPRTPWVSSEIDAAVTALRELAAALTPAPIAVPTAAEQLAGDFAGWSRLAASVPPDLDPWAVERLPQLRAAAERGLAALRTGETLTHCDIRADNILVRGDGSMIFVDWPWGCTGPEWLDRLLLALNVIVHGGDPSPALTDIDHQVATDVIAGLAGYFEHVCRLPPPPGIPTVRAFQRWQAEALRPWLRSRPLP